MINTYEFKAMGSRVFSAIDVPGSMETSEMILLSQWFEAWEQKFSRFRIDSELSKANHSDGRPFEVSQEFWEVLIQARRAEEISQGLVTPVIENALIASGYAYDFHEINPELKKTVSAVHPNTGSTNDVILDADQHLVQIQPGYQLDFGGIVKGWAAHQAAQNMGRHGPCLVNAGGDIAITSAQIDGSPWLIGIADPLHPPHNLAMIQVASGGVATSGTDFRRWKLNGAFQHHILDPRTGFPAVTDVLCATVIAPTVMDAETHAKTALILGGFEGISWLDAHEQVAGFLVLNDGHILLSQQMDQYLWREHVATILH